MKWTESEEKLLIENVLLSVNSLALLLNKTESSIRNRKLKLGIISGRSKHFTEEEINIIISWYEKFGDEINLDDLSKCIDRPKTSICRVAKKYNLTLVGRISKKDIEKSTNNLLSYVGTKEWEGTSKIGQDILIYKSKNNHYKGMLGKNHKKEVKLQMSDAHFKIWNATSDENKKKHGDKIRETKRNNGSFKTTKNSYSNCRGGKREDLNQYFRSSWEANIARIFNFLNIKWEYEIKRFHFNELDKGILSYQPDFYLPEIDIWIEVKGWFDEKYKVFEKEYKNFIPFWELKQNKKVS